MNRKKEAALKAVAQGRSMASVARSMVLPYDMVRTWVREQRQTTPKPPESEPTPTPTPHSDRSARMLLDLLKENEDMHAHILALEKEALEEAVVEVLKINQKLQVKLKQLERNKEAKVTRLHAVGC